MIFRKNYRVLSLWARASQSQAVSLCLSESATHNDKYRETLINEEALLLAKYFRGENDSWIPRIPAFPFQRYSNVK